MEPKLTHWRKLLFTRATSIALIILTVVLLVAAVVAPFVARHWAHRDLADRGAVFVGGNDSPKWIQRLGNHYPKSLLRWKGVACYGLTPGSFASIRHFPEVEVIILRDVAWFGDGECIHLAALPKLLHLELAGTTVSDAGVAQLAQCPSLEQLHLKATQITDASVPLLAKLHRLKQLEITETKITAAGVRSLKTSLPACEIDADY